MQAVKFDEDGNPLGSFEEGVECAIEMFARSFGIDVNDFSWDAATEEWEGDVMAVIANCITARFGDDWHDIPQPSN